MIDWDGESSVDQSLAWGYRWDGAATGEDFLRAVLAADSRLYAKISPGGLSGIAVYGVGYDQNDDCQFAIDDGTTFDADGINISSPADLAASVDQDDLYREGWFLGFWLVGTATTNPYSGGTWSWASTGVSNINLTDNAWTSLAYTTDTFSTTAFAENPISAELPNPSADFDLDDDVDGIDFLSWQRGFGITSGAHHGQGDANCNQAIEDADLQIWEENFGTSAVLSHSHAVGYHVPEPQSMVLLMGMLIISTTFQLRMFCGLLTKTHTF